MAWYGEAYHFSRKNLPAMHGRRQLIDFIKSDGIDQSNSILRSSVEDTTVFNADEARTFGQKVKNAARIMYKFSRPHTIKVISHW